MVLSSPFSREASHYRESDRSSGSGSWSSVSLGQYTNRNVDEAPPKLTWDGLSGFVSVGYVYFCCPESEYHPSLSALVISMI